MKKTLLSLATALTIMVGMVGCKDLTKPYINPEVPFVETSFTAEVSSVTASSAAIKFSLGDANAMFYPVCDAATSVNPDAAIADLKSFVADYAADKGLTEAQTLKKVLRVGTSTPVFTDLEKSTDYVAYAIQADLNGNMAYVASSKQAFTTEAEAVLAPITGIYSAEYTKAGVSNFTLETYGTEGLFNLLALMPPIEAYGFGFDYISSFDLDAMVVTVDQILIGGEACAFGEPFVTLNDGAYLGALMGGETGTENWQYAVDATMHLSEALVDVEYAALNPETGAYVGYFELLKAGSAVSYVGPAAVASKVIDTKYGKLEFHPVTPDNKYAGMKFDVSNAGTLPRI